jgi:hypothetical protein
MHWQVTKARDKYKLPFPDWGDPTPDHDITFEEGPTTLPSNILDKMKRQIKEKKK